MTGAQCPPCPRPLSESRMLGLGVRTSQRCREGPAWGQAAQGALGAEPLSPPDPTRGRQSQTRRWALAQEARLSWPHPGFAASPVLPHSPRDHGRWGQAAFLLTARRPPARAHLDPLYSCQCLGGPCGPAGGQSWPLRGLSSCPSQTPTFLSALKLTAAEAWGVWL